MLEPYIEIWMELKFDWIMVIENDKNTFLILIKFVGYMKFKNDFNIIILLYWINKKN